MTSSLTESALENWLLEALADLKYTVRRDIRDRAALNAREGITGLKDRPEGWPASAHALGRRLRKIAPVLRAVGIEVRQERGKERIWTVASKPEETSVDNVEVSSDMRFEPDDGPAGHDTQGAESVETTLPCGAVSNPGTNVLNLIGASINSSNTFDTSAPVPAGRGETRRIEL